MASGWGNIAGFDWAAPLPGLESTLAFEEMRLAINDRAKCFQGVEEIPTSEVVDLVTEYFEDKTHSQKFKLIQGRLTDMLGLSADFSLFSDSVGSISNGAHVATYDNYQGITESPPPVRSSNAMWDYCGTLLSEDLDFWRDTSPSVGRVLDKDYLRQFYLIMGLIRYVVFFQNQWFEPISNRGTTKGTAVMREKFVYCWFYQLNHIDTCVLTETPAYDCLIQFYDSDPDIASDPNDANMRGYVNRFSEMEQFPGPQGYYCEYQGYSRYGDAKVEVPTALAGLSFSTFNLVNDLGGSLNFDGFAVTNEGFNTITSSTAGDVVTIPIPSISSSEFTQLVCRTDITNGGTKSDYVSYNADSWAFVTRIDDAAILDYYT